MNNGRHESINRKNSTALQGAAEWEPFDQSGAWGENFPQQAKGDFRHPEISLFGVPGERTFYRVKVPNPPGSGKG